MPTRYLFIILATIFTLAIIIGQLSSCTSTDRQWEESGRVLEHTQF